MSPQRIQATLVILQLLTTDLTRTRKPNPAHRGGTPHEAYGEAPYPRPSWTPLASVPPMLATTYETTTDPVAVGSPNFSAPRTG